MEGTNKTPPTKGPFEAVNNLVRSPMPQGCLVATVALETDSDAISSRAEAYATAKLLSVAPELADSLTEVLAVFRNCIGHAAFAEFETGNTIIRDAKALLVNLGRQ